VASLLLFILGGQTVFCFFFFVLLIMVAFCFEINNFLPLQQSGSVSYAGASLLDKTLWGS